MQKTGQQHIVVTIVGLIIAFGFGIACEPLQIRFEAESKPASGQMVFTEEGYDVSMEKSLVHVQAVLRDGDPVFGANISVIYDRIALGVSQVNPGSLFPTDDYLIVPENGSNVLSWDTQIIDQNLGRLNIWIEQNQQSGSEIEVSGEQSLFVITFYSSDITEDTNVDIEVSPESYVYNQSDEPLYCGVQSIDCPRIRTGGITVEQ